MKKYTQQEFDALPVVDGIKQCPTGDYSELKSFGELCSFGERCSFGEGCSFGKRCSFENGYQAKYPAFIRINNIGSRGDGCYIYNFENSIYVRSGCFFGTVDEFMQAVHRKHSDTKFERQYKLAVELAKTAFE